MPVLKLVTQSLLYRNRSLLFMMGLALLLNLALWVYIGTAERPRETIVPLHYNIYFGIDLFAEWYKIYLLPTSGAVILGINAVAGFTFLGRDKILSAAVAVITLAVEVILLVSTYLIFSEIYYS